MKQSWHILVIDPDKQFQDEYRNLFIHSNYEIESSSGFTEAVEKLKYVSYDCIIMDIDLPEIKGYEAAAIIKTILPDVKIIMTSNENSIETEKKVREQDIYYYYIKSFNKEEIRMAIDHLFQLRGNHKMDEKKMILIIDDDRDYVEATRTYLDANQYQTETAYTKSEALRKIKNMNPDLILLDIMMEYPANGFSICYQIKHDSRLQDIPVLVVSGITKKTGLHFSPKTNGEYFQADDYLEKPVEPEIILRKIKELLQIHK